MLSSVVAVLALAAASHVAASPITHVARDYAQDAEILEDYIDYHVRYLALKCQDQHNSQFFDDCCHPLLRTQKLSDRPAKCIPSASASSSAVLAEPTAAPIDEDPVYYDDDCEDDETPTPAPAVTKAAVTKAVISEAPEPTTTTTSSKPESTSTKPTSTKPTSTKPASTTSSAEPAASSAPSGGDGAFTGGYATFFTQNGNAGACGKTHDDYTPVVAADYRRYGDLSKQSELCGKRVVITNTNNGKTVTATVADACPTCNNENSLDLSLGAFDQIATREEGMVPISWYFA